MGGREMGSLHLAAGRDPGGGPGREAECLTNTQHSGHTFNGLTQKGVWDQLKRTKAQVK